MCKIQTFISYVYNNKLGIVVENMSFKQLTSLKVGGTCAVYFEPNEVNSLALALTYLKDQDISYFIIGNGTNLLVNDKAFIMVVISLKHFQQMEMLEEGFFRIGAGVSSPKIAHFIAQKGYTGAEFMSVIPGSLGGLIYMNAGAYQRNMQDILVSVQYLDETGTVQTMTDDQFQFGYRKSVFQNHGYIILEAILQVGKASNPLLPLEKIKHYANIKRDSQPVGSKNAGSTFKNPRDCPSWKVIDQLGYRGFQIGGAMVSVKHANFLINVHQATFDDMMTLIQLIQQDAKEELQIDLQCEWEIIQ